MWTLALPLLSHLGVRRDWSDLWGTIVTQKIAHLWERWERLEQKSRRWGRSKKEKEWPQTSSTWMWWSEDNTDQLAIPEWSTRIMHWLGIWTRWRRAPHLSADTDYKINQFTLNPSSSTSLPRCFATKNLYESSLEGIERGSCSFDWFNWSESKRCLGGVIKEDNLTWREDQLLKVVRECCDDKYVASGLLWRVRDVTMSVITSTHKSNIIPGLWWCL